MKTLLAALACGTLLIGGAAWAQPGQTANDNTNRHGSAVNPTPPASQTTTAAPATTAKTGSEHKARTASQERCRKATDDKSVRNKDRAQYLSNCPGKLAPR